MHIDRLSGMTQAQRDRLAFVELRLRFVGEIRRQDLITRFDIQAAAATRDIAQYKELAPRNMEYDPKGKVYVRAPWFRPLFDFSAGRVLVWLSQGYGDAEPAPWKGAVPTEGTSLTSHIDLELVPVWEALHQLIRALNQQGESAAGALLARMPNQADTTRALAYRLYTLCERKVWAEEARAYNELVTAWSAVERAAGEAGVVGSQAQWEM